MTKKEKFIEGIVNTIGDINYSFDEEMLRLEEKKYYYKDEDYGKSMKDIFLLLGIKSKELNPVRNHPNNMSICSIASSGRLCFLYFYGIYKDFYTKYINNEIKIESYFKNPTGNGNPTQLDAKTIENGIVTYYECKCQEPINGESNIISDSYNKLLKKYFNINEYKNPKNIFHIKQLYTHLIAIAQNHHKEDKVNLKYIFFIPKGFKKSEMYIKLEEEINKIRASRTLAFYIDNHMKNFELSKPDFIEVSKDCFKKDPKEIYEELLSSMKQKTPK